MIRRWVYLASLTAVLAVPAWSQPRRKVIIDQDCSGPGGSNLQAIMTLIQSRQVEPLGVTVVTGNQWRDEEMVHTLRLLEIVGRPDIPVLPGAVFPLVHSRKEAEVWERLYGKISYLGAWDSRWWHEPFVVPPLAEGQPVTKPSSEDAAHFMIRMVHQYPHQVTIFEGGPMTDLALAIRLDPQFAELAQELVFMGGSFNPQSSDPEWASDPRHEFNFWFDPEAAHIVLSAHWANITCTPVDISIKTHFTRATAEEIAKSGTPLARYLLKYYVSEIDYMWDELAAAAWLDSSIITQAQSLYMDVDLNHGRSYGNTLSWFEGDKPALNRRLIRVLMEVDTARFYRLFVALMSGPTPTRD
jgi:purine nucleosidase